MSRRMKAILIVIGAFAALALMFAVPMLWRARANDALARELHAEFDKWLASLPHVPDSENGALVIAPYLERLSEPASYLYLMKPDELRGEEAHKQRREYIAANREVLESVEKALDQYSKWQFTVNYSENYSATLYHLAGVKEVGDCLVEKAILLQHEGQNEQALRECLKALRVASALTADRVMVSYECQIAVYRQALAEAMRILGHDRLPEESIRGALDALSTQYGKRGAFENATEAEYYMFSKLLADGIREGKSALSLVCRIEGGGKADDRSFFGGSKYVYDYTPDVELFREHLKAYAGTKPGEYFKFRQKLESWNEHVRSIATNIKSPRAVLACLVLPAIGERAFKDFVIGETFWRAAMVMIALRLFEANNGRLPDKLEELGELVSEEMMVDPFSGKHLVYKLKDGDFCLYSVGVDGMDGKCEETRELFRTRADEGEPDDIIFHAPRR